MKGLNKAVIGGRRIKIEPSRPGVLRRYDFTALITIHSSKRIGILWLGLMSKESRGFRKS
jgi:hypothetical protein